MHLFKIKWLSSGSVLLALGILFRSSSIRLGFLRLLLGQFLLLFLLSPPLILCSCTYVPTSPRPNPHLRKQLLYICISSLLARPVCRTVLPIETSNECHR